MTEQTTENNGAHWHITIGMDGYVPETVLTITDIADLPGLIESEVSQCAESQYEEADNLAENEEYKDAWNVLLRSRSLDILAENFSDKRTAFMAPEMLEETLKGRISESFPVRVAKYSNMNVYVCYETECDLSNEE